MSPPPLTRAALRVSSRAGYLFALAVAAFVAAWYVHIPQMALTLVIVGATFVMLALIVQTLTLRHSRQMASPPSAMAGAFDSDPCVVFTTDEHGLIQYQNPSAAERFGDRVGDTPTELLRGLFATPSTVLLRLQNRAQAVGSAREDITLRRGQTRLSVHQTEQGFLWRLDELGDRTASSRSGQVSVPMMTVSRSGTILFMNPAARRALGGRETTLERVFIDWPVKPGTVTLISTEQGPLPAYYAEVELSAGRREIYLLPQPPAPMISKREWSLAEDLPVPLIRLDGAGKITMANRRARDLLSDDAAEGTLLSEQVEGLGRPVSEWLREALTGRHLGKTEVVRAVKPSEDVFLQISLEQTTEEDGPALVAVLQDATELKSLEAQFVQSQKMEAIGQLAGGVAHDFNNLLTAISGHCDLLLLGRDENDPEYSDLSQIHQNSNRAAALVRQLLGFSRKQTLRPEELDLTETVSDLMHLLNRLVGEKIQLELDHDDALNLIRVDRRQLDQVLMNIVVNARDAMPDGGEIRVETRNVLLEQALKRDRASVPPGDYVTIRVIDHGTGIPADKIGKIFEPFFTTKKAGQGTGLGLSMAYGIVKQMGGFIFVDSMPGSGTTFSLYFPVAVPSEAPVASEIGDAPPPDAVPMQDAPANISSPQAAQAGADQAISDVLSTLRGETPEPAPSVGEATSTASDDVLVLSDEFAPAAPVAEAPAAPPEIDETLENSLREALSDPEGVVLLVEDEAPVRAFAARALRLRGYTVLEADTAEAALETLEDETLKVDIFVTDVVMPGMDGPTWVAEAMKTRPDVKVVFVSGYSEDSVAEHQARIPNSVFLPKPFSLTDLTVTVRQQLS